MLEFYYTDEASDFIKSGASRETSDEIMAAIAKIARNPTEAERIWEAPTDDETCAIAQIATKNGADGIPSDYCWGAAGSDWAEPPMPPCYVQINSRGRERLIDYLAHRSTVFDLERVADKLIDEHDGSNPGATQMVEIPGKFTKTGNAETYHFGPDEYDLILIED